MPWYIDYTLHEVLQAFFSQLQAGSVCSLHIEPVFFFLPNDIIISVHTVSVLILHPRECYDTKLLLREHAVELP